QCRCADAAEESNSRCSSQSEEATATAMDRWSRCCNTGVDRGRCCSLREANIQNASGGRIGFRSRTLVSRDLTSSLLLCRQDCATINQNDFDVPLIVVGQHELRVRCDVERAE